MQRTIPCSVMRGGTSKGLYFATSDLPADASLRDRVLLAAMGSPDARQIDGMGGADPLTSKVGVIGPPTRPDADVDYLFLQVVVDEARVDPHQNCGNILAGVGPYAIDHGLVAAGRETTDVRIHMVNTKSLAVATVQTPDGQVEYQGATRIDGVPGTAAPILLDFRDIAGSSTGGRLLPTGRSRDTILGVEVTCIDNGMPVVLLRAADLGKRGDEKPAALEADAPLREKVEAIRLVAGKAMNLGDVTRKNVPKMCLISPARNGGALATRTFIPHRVHTSIGVLGAISVATACVVPDSIAAELVPQSGGRRRMLDIEHPTGFFSVELETAADDPFAVTRSALVRTARLIMRGEVYVAAGLWDPAA